MGCLMKYYDQKELGRRIKAVRQDEGIKQIDLAIEMNISRDMLSRIENGKNACAPDHLMFLCQRFNKTADYFYFGTEDEPYETRSRMEIMTEINQMLGGLSKTRLIYIYRIMKRKDI